MLQNAFARFTIKSKSLLRAMAAVSVLRAVSQYAAPVRTACDSGADALVVGAGLPLDLPGLTAGHPGVALIPILADARGIATLLKKTDCGVPA